MEKSIAILFAAVGALFVIGSMMIVNYPNEGKWFPIFLILGGALLWYGIRKYRAA